MALARPVFKVRVGQRAQDVHPVETREPDPEQLEEAREEGRQEGLAAGRAEAERELASLRAALEAAMVEVRQTLSDELEGIEERVLELGLAIAERILEREVSSTAAEIKGRVADLLERAGDEPEVRIALHPDDFDLLDEATREDERFVVDRALQPGDVVVTTVSGRLERTRKGQLEAVRSALGGELAA